MVAFAGALAALAGGYWDDGWHTERGRDEFLIAPHIAIYGGIALAGAAVSFWALLVVRRSGTRAALAHRPLALALLAVGVTLASGPIDNGWHVAFGRDAVIWSPPHMLGIVGTLAIAVAILAELAKRPERWAGVARVMAAGLVLAAAAFATVEYDTDVPQFAEVWYLPTLGVASVVGLLLIRAAAPSPWSATAATMVYTAFVVAVGIALTIAGFPGPAVPALVIPAVLLDLSARREWTVPASAAAYAAGLFAAYVPIRNWLGSGVELGLTDVLIGLPLTWASVMLALLLTRFSRPGSPRRGAPAVVATILLLLAFPSAAVAHDPGQGDDAGTIALRVAVDDDLATVSGTVPPALCRDSSPRALLARRAGRTIQRPLEKSGCRVSGSVRLPDRGRWFVYTRLDRAGETIEAWLPIVSGSGREVVSEPNRYAYVASDEATTAAQAVLGGLLYVGVAGLLWACFALLRPQAKQARP